MSLLVGRRCRWQPFALRSFSTTSTGVELLNCYETLGLDADDCDKDRLKLRYLELAKRYHPDSGGTQADANRFSMIQQAYQTITRNDFFDTDRADLEAAQESLYIRHTAPQHRQYLEFEGVGGGTPSQRQRQYQQWRVQRATDNVHSRRMEQIVQNDGDGQLATTRRQAEYTRKVKTRTAMDRLVEDLIIESMRKGEFDNLSGAGKPLQFTEHNPYLDATSHRVNKILVQNGFSPPWVMLERDVKMAIRQMRRQMADRGRQIADAVPQSHWTKRQNVEWERYLQSLGDDFAALNKQIDRLNLIVPVMSRQIVHLSVKREARWALETESRDNLSDEKSEERCDNVNENDQDLGSPALDRSNSYNLFDALMRVLKLKE